MKTNSNHVEPSEGTSKRAYHKPQFHVFGGIEELTQATTSGTGSDSSVGYADHALS